MCRNVSYRSRDPQMTDAPPKALHEAHSNAKCGERKDPPTDRSEGKYRTSLMRLVRIRDPKHAAANSVNAPVFGKRIHYQPRRPVLCHPLNSQTMFRTRSIFLSNQARKEPVLSWFTGIPQILFFSSFNYDGYSRILGFSDAPMKIFHRCL